MCDDVFMFIFFFFFKQKTAYEMRISDWSSDVCSSDLSVHQTGSNGGHVMPSRDQSLTVGNLDAVNPFERQHAPGGTVPVNGGNDIDRLRHHRFGQLRSGCGPYAPIELTRGQALTIRNHPAGTQAGCTPSPQFQKCCCTIAGISITACMSVEY